MFSLSLVSLKFLAAIAALNIFLKEGKSKTFSNISDIHWMEPDMLPMVRTPGQNPVEEPQGRQEWMPTGNMSRKLAASSRGNWLFVRRKCTK